MFRPHKNRSRASVAQVVAFRQTFYEDGQRARAKYNARIRDSLPLLPRGRDGHCVFWDETKNADYIVTDRVAHARGGDTDHITRLLPTATKRIVTLYFLSAPQSTAYAEFFCRLRSAGDRVAAVDSFIRAIQRQLKLNDEPTVDLALLLGDTKNVNSSLVDTASLIYNGLTVALAWQTTRDIDQTKVVYENYKRTVVNPEDAFRFAAKARYTRSSLDQLCHSRYTLSPADAATVAFEDDGDGDGEEDQAETRTAPLCARYRRRVSDYFNAFVGSRAVPVIPAFESRLYWLFWNTVGGPLFCDHSGDSGRAVGAPDDRFRPIIQPDAAPQFRSWTSGRQHKYRRARLFARLGIDDLAECYVQFMRDALDLRGSGLHEIRRLQAAQHLTDIPVHSRSVFTFEYARVLYGTVLDTGEWEERLATGLRLRFENDAARAALCEEQRVLLRDALQRVSQTAVHKLRYDLLNKGLFVALRKFRISKPKSIAAYFTEHFYPDDPTAVVGIPPNLFFSAFRVGSAIKTLRSDCGAVVESNFAFLLAVADGACFLRRATRHRYGDDIPEARARDDDIFVDIQTVYNLVRDLATPKELNATDAAQSELVENADFRAQKPRLMALQEVGNGGGLTTFYRHAFVYDPIAVLAESVYKTGTSARTIREGNASRANAIGCDLQLANGDGAVFDNHWLRECCVATRIFWRSWLNEASRYVPGQRVWPASFRNSRSYLPTFNEALPDSGPLGTIVLDCDFKSSRRKPLDFSQRQMSLAKLLLVAARVSQCLLKTFYQVVNGCKDDDRVDSSVDPPVKPIDFYQQHVFAFVSYCVKTSDDRRGKCKGTTTRDYSEDDVVEDDVVEDQDIVMDDEDAMDDDPIYNDDDPVPDNEWDNSDNERDATRLSDKDTTTQSYVDDEDTINSGSSAFVGGDNSAVPAIVCAAKNDDLFAETDGGSGDNDHALLRACAQIAELDKCSEWAEMARASFEPAANILGKKIGLRVVFQPPGYAFASRQVQLLFVQTVAELLKRSRFVAHVCEKLHIGIDSVIDTGVYRAGALIRLPLMMKLENGVLNRQLLPLFLSPQQLLERDVYNPFAFSYRCRAVGGNAPDAIRLIAMRCDKEHEARALQSLSMREYMAADRRALANGVDAPPDRNRYICHRDFASASPAVAVAADIKPWHRAETTDSDFEHDLDKVQIARLSICGHRLVTDPTFCELLRYLFLREVGEVAPNLGQHFCDFYVSPMDCKSMRTHPTSRNNKAHRVRASVRLPFQSVSDAASTICLAKSARSSNPTTGGRPRYSAVIGLAGQLSAIRFVVNCFTRSCRHNADQSLSKTVYLVHQLRRGDPQPADWTVLGKWAFKRKKTPVGHERARSEKRQKV